VNTKIVIEDYVAPAKAPHALAPTVDALIKAGPDKVATAAFDTEADALAFVRSMQTAAREAGYSALKRRFEEVEGKWVAGVSVRAKITRNRPTATPVDVEQASEDTAPIPTEEAPAENVTPLKNKNAK